MTHWTDRLAQLDACSDAVAWARRYDSLKAAWAACERADWMLWLAGKVCGDRGSDGHRKLVLATCSCARTALRYVPEGEYRPRVAIETAERWARGEATDDELSAANAAAEAAAWAAARAVRAAKAARATWAAAGAAAWAAAEAADWAARVAAGAARAAWAAEAAAWTAANAAASKDMADMLRRDHYPEPPEIGGAA